MNLKNRKVLITGATGGIGNALVEKFHELGSTIVATGTNLTKLENLKKKYKTINTEQFKLDHHDKIEDFIDRVHNKLEGLDILVNNNEYDFSKGKVSFFRYRVRKQDENNDEEEAETV